MPTRLASSFALPPPDDPLRPSYTTRRDDHQFAKQYANLYWLRLVVLRKRVLERARRKWEGAGKLEGQSLASLSCVSCSNFPSARIGLQQRALLCRWTSGNALKRALSTRGYRDRGDANGLVLPARTDCLGRAAAAASAGRQGRPPLREKNTTPRLRWLRFLPVRLQKRL